ncbi:uncharacterized protein KY384_007381 [Bacidia gigantensis]|uniref:uncharacterized protein n=1 Tax=Bacidia gigantensis TaxID=2732470 RepID=UPI001D04A7F2|nr:uncharacterized protein KY384_007381 [Bacidia gigantensis]KAG8528463.1 hypothetical protein KY384_007381 [Bacidia gigantensis]
MAEVLGAVSSITTLIEVSFKVSRYLLAVKDGQKDRDRVRQEISMITGMLSFLKDQVAASNEDPEIFATLQTLVAPQGPLDQFADLLKRLESKLVVGGGAKKIGKSFLWPFRKEEVKNILASLERQKAFFDLAQQNDHIRLSQAIRYDVADMKQRMSGIDEKLSQLMLDALDEYQDSPGIVEMLSRLQQSTSINILITSRPVISIEQRLENVRKVEIRAHNDDLKLYISNRIPTLHCIRSRPELQALVADEIIHAADGMFLLARLHFDSLLDRASPKAIKNALEKVPKGSNALPFVYNSKMDRINNQTSYSRDQAIKVLSWLFFALRPLSISELEAALAIEIGSEEFDKDNITNIDHLTSLCKGFATIDRESEIVRFSHYTVREFFDSTHEKHLPKAQAYIAKTCLTCISCINFQQRPRRGSDSKLENYALRNWGEHARHAQSELESLALTFFGKENNVKVIFSMIQYSLGDRYWSSMIPDPELASIYMCAYFDLDVLAKRLIEEGANPHVGKTFSRSPLAWAIREDNINIIPLLMEFSCGPRSNVSQKLTGHPERQWTCDEDGDGLLHYAIKAGSTEAVKVLLEHDNVDINAQNHKGNTPLALAAAFGLFEISAVAQHCSLAAAHGQETIGELLLGPHELDINGVGYSGYTGSHSGPLSIRGEYLRTLQVLLERESIDINGKHSGGQTALIFAVRTGIVQVVESLLSRHDIDVNGKDDAGATALTYASQAGHSRMVRLLLHQPGIKPDSQDFVGRTPLSYAVSYGWKSVVSYFLSRSDIEPNLRLRNGRTPLLLAVVEGGSRYGQGRYARSGKYVKEEGETRDFTEEENSRLSYDILKLLLQHPTVDPLACDDKNMGALQYAVMKGNKDHLRLLLTHEKVHSYLCGIVKSDGYVYSDDLGSLSGHQVRIKKFDITSENMECCEA